MANTNVSSVLLFGLTSLAAGMGLALSSPEPQPPGPERPAEPV